MPREKRSYELTERKIHEDKLYTSKWLKQDNAREFYFSKDPVNAGYSVYKKRSAQIKPGITVLVGCNGSGKSTLLNIMKDILKKEDIPVFTYDNYRNGGLMGLDIALEHNARLFATLAFSSEGERIVQNFGAYMRSFGDFVRRHQSDKEIWLILDAVESGLSIDNVRELKEFFQFVLENEAQGDKSIFIVVSTNTYEFCTGTQCYDVQNGKYIELKTYDEYCDFIMKSRELKDNLKAKAMGGRR